METVNVRSVILTACLHLPCHHMSRLTGQHKLLLSCEPKPTLPYVPCTRPSPRAWGIRQVSPLPKVTSPENNTLVVSVFIYTREQSMVRRSLLDVLEDAICSFYQQSSCSWQGLWGSYRVLVR